MLLPAGRLLLRGGLSHPAQLQGLSCTASSRLGEPHALSQVRTQVVTLADTQADTPAVTPVGTPVVIPVVTPVVTLAGTQEALPVATLAAMACIQEVSLPELCRGITLMAQPRGVRKRSSALACPGRTQRSPMLVHHPGMVAMGIWRRCSRAQGCREAVWAATRSPLGWLLLCQALMGLWRRWVQFVCSLAAAGPLHGSSEKRYQAMLCLSCYMRAASEHDRAIVSHTQPGVSAGASLLGRLLHRWVRCPLIYCERLHFDKQVHARRWGIWQLAMLGRLVACRSRLSLGETGADAVHKAGMSSHVGDVVAMLV